MDNDSGAFAKLRKVTISFVMSLGQSVLLHRTRPPMNEFSLNLLFKTLRTGLLNCLNARSGV